MEFAKIASVDYLVVHCADTYARMDIGAKEIDQWHRQKGWLKIGYHYVIRRDGTIEKGRRDDEVGAHTLGYNRNSLGIVWVGGKGDNDKPQDNSTPAQRDTLSTLLHRLKGEYPAAKIVGHKELNPGRDCPVIDLHKFLKENGLENP